MASVNRARGVGAALVAIALGACAPATASSPSGRAPSPAPPQTPAVGDTTSGLVPPGRGTLRQDDIAIKIQLPNVLVKLIPLDESVIRVLSADSYQALRQVAESRRAEVARLATLHGLRERRLWYVTFIGLAPDARFTPTDLTMSSGGRDFRPLEVLPLSAGFGNQRLELRQPQAALLLFDDGVDVSQPLAVTSGTQRNTDWQQILQTIERERASILGRAARGGV